ncbi:hypothetical protein [Streptomyces sp. NPDC054961]
MTLLEMGGAEVQRRLAGWPEGDAPCGVAAAGFDTAVAVFDAVAAGLDAVAPGFDAVVAGFDAAAEFFVWGVADRAAVRGEDDVADGVGDGAAGHEGCAGTPIAGASACTPIRLLPMATARIAPMTETGQPRPRSRRPRRPDWSTNTGAGAGSSKFDPDTSGDAWWADSRETGVMTGRTLRGLSVHGTKTGGQQGAR